MNTLRSTRRILHRMALTLPLVLALGLGSELSRPALAQEMNANAYDIGTPTLTDLWVNPATGNDSNTGNSRTTPLRSLGEAWRRVPMGTTLTTTGYRIQLVAGDYPDTLIPAYMEQRYGTYACPVIINSVDGPGQARIPNLNIADCRYLYIIGLNMTSRFDILHYEACRNILLRQCQLVGVGNQNNYEGPQETFKANQCQYLYVEDCDISGAYDNAVDCVAVQYGHFLRNKIHRSVDWCMYLKGGSAYFRVEGNEFSEGGTGGFTAGQGTGFEFMTAPWLHYEAYDIKFLNNIIHDTEGAAFGVNGGYNILMAYNTAYRVGRRSHAIELEFGSRSCDGDTVRCQNYLNQGGWGTAIASESAAQPIPNRNVYIYNNIIYNPAGYQSQWAHFAFPGPRTTAAGSNIPSPAVTDNNLRIAGNILWNGAPDLDLGIGGSSACQPSNPTCNETLLRANNWINTLQPQLINPAGGDFRPVAGGNVFTVAGYAIPDFPGNDRPSRPLSPAGNYANLVPRDITLATRAAGDPPGAYRGSGTVTLPAAPTTLQATAQSTSSIRLAWADNANNEAGFRVERRTTTGSYLLITNLAANTTSYTDNGLASSTAYTYRVRAYNAAGDSGNSNEATATTQAAGVRSVSLSPSQVVGGYAVSTGVVTLDRVAPTGGAVVTLTSSDTTAATVPTSVTVPAGRVRAAFRITTLAVTAQRSPVIRARYNGVEKGATLRVNPVGLSSIVLLPNTVIGGENSLGIVTLNVGAARSAVTVQLRSSNASVVAVPATLTIPAGENTLFFDLDTFAVTANTAVTITVTVNSSTLSTTLTVTP